MRSHLYGATISTYVSLSPRTPTTFKAVPPYSPCIHKAYHVLDELIIGGELQEPSKKAILRVTAAQDALMEDLSDANTNYEL